MYEYLSVVRKVRGGDFIPQTEKKFTLRYTLPVLKNEASFDGVK